MPIGPFISECLVRAFIHFSETAQVEAFSSLVMVQTPDDNGFGSGVVMGQKTILTAHHNFLKANPKNSIIHHVSTGLTTKVSSVLPLKKLDLTILKIDKPLSLNFCAQVDKNSEAFRGMRVMIPSFFEENSLGRTKDSGNLSNHFRMQTIKGLLLSPEETIHLANNQNRMASLFHLRSRPGHSGCGIFNREGKLLTILSTGNGYGSSGPTIKQFRNFVSQNNFE